MEPKITYDGTHFTYCHVHDTYTGYSSYSTPAGLAAAHFQGSDAVVDQCRALRAAWVPPAPPHLQVPDSSYRIDRATGALHCGHGMLSRFSTMPLDAVLRECFVKGSVARSLYYVFAALKNHHSE